MSASTSIETQPPPKFEELTFYRYKRVPTFPPSMFILLSLLAKREVVTREAAFTVLFSHKPRKNQLSDPKDINVYFRRLNEKLRPYGMRIRAQRNVGYKLDPASRQRVILAMKSEAASRDLEA